MEKSENDVKRFIASMEGMLAGFTNSVGAYTDFDLPAKKSGCGICAECGNKSCKRNKDKGRDDCNIFMPKSE